MSKPQSLSCSSLYSLLSGALFPSRFLLAGFGSGDMWDFTTAMPVAGGSLETVLPKPRGLWVTCKLAIGSMKGKSPGALRKLQVGIEVDSILSPSLVLLSLSLPAQQEQSCVSGVHSVQC